jgi:hypothetical protein
MHSKAAVYANYSGQSSTYAQKKVANSDNSKMQKALLGLVLEVRALGIRGFLGPQVNFAVNTLIGRCHCVRVSVCVCLFVRMYNYMDLYAHTHTHTGTLFDGAIHSHVVVLVQINSWKTMLVGCNIAIEYFTEMLGPGEPVSD